MCFSANFPTSYRNVSVSGEYGNSTREKKAILKFGSHLFGLISLLSLKIGHDHGLGHGGGSAYIP